MVALSPNAAPVRLTSFAPSANVSDEAAFARALRELAAVNHGTVSHRVSPTRALVATLDFYAPMLDDAASWGAVSLAGALSGIYAAGATPIFAMTVVGWPHDLPAELLDGLLQGSAETAWQAECALLGGHRMESDVPRFGVAAIGEMNPGRGLGGGRAADGDVLLLTKPLGSGILCHALRHDALLESGMTDAIASMCRLNHGAARAAAQIGVTAATDVGPLGLVGHLRLLLEGSGVAATLAADALPVLHPAATLIARGLVPPAARRNLALAERVRWDDDVSVTERIICADPQISGGLLLAVAPEKENDLVGALEAEGAAAAAIGRVTAGEPGHITVRRGV